MMGGDRGLIFLIDSITDAIGRWVAWSVIFMAILTIVVVVLRYGLNAGSIFTQEAVTYLHGTLFTLGAAYTLKSGRHVRVDVFYRRFSPEQKAWVDAIGGIMFLIPFCFFVFVITWSYVMQSWATLEVSADPGGIPAVFLLKSLMPAMACGLCLQGVAEVFKSIFILLNEESND